MQSKLPHPNDEEPKTPLPVEPEARPEDSIDPAEMALAAVVGTRYETLTDIVARIKDRNYHYDVTPDEDFEVPFTQWEDHNEVSSYRANYSSLCQAFKPWLRKRHNGTGRATDSDTKFLILPVESVMKMPAEKWTEFLETLEYLRDDSSLYDEDAYSELEMKCQDQVWQESARAEWKEYLKLNLEDYFEGKTFKDGRPVWPYVNELLDSNEVVDEMWYEYCSNAGGGEFEAGGDGIPKLRIDSIHDDLTRWRSWGKDRRPWLEIWTEQLLHKFIPEDPRQTNMSFYDDVRDVTRETAESVVDTLLQSPTCVLETQTTAARVMVAELMEDAGPHSYSCIMAPLPEEMAELIVAWGKHQIPDTAIYVDEDGGCGREEEQHITVKYGLTAAMPSESLLNIFKTTAPFDVTILPISLFKNDKFDVVKMDISGPQLLELNRRVCASEPFVDKYPVYHPHVTIAYVKPGTCDRLEGMSPWDHEQKMGVSDIGKKGTFQATKVIFSSTTGDKKTYDLGPKQLKEMEEDELPSPDDIIDRSGFVSRNVSLAYLRRVLTGSAVDSVDISRKDTRKKYSEGILAFKMMPYGIFQNAGVPKTLKCEFASFDVLKSCIRQWRNLYGAPLTVEGEPAGKVDYRNPALADTPPAAP